MNNEEDQSDHYPFSDAKVLEKTNIHAFRFVKQDVNEKEREGAADLAPFFNRIRDKQENEGI